MDNWLSRQTATQTAVKPVLVSGRFFNRPGYLLRPGRLIGILDSLRLNPSLGALISPLDGRKGSYLQQLRDFY